MPFLFVKYFTYPLQLNLIHGFCSPRLPFPVLFPNSTTPKAQNERREINMVAHTTRTFSNHAIPPTPSQIQSTNDQTKEEKRSQSLLKALNQPILQLPLLPALRLQRIHGTSQLVLTDQNGPSPRRTQETNLHSRTNRVIKIWL